MPFQEFGDNICIRLCCYEMHFQAFSVIWWQHGMFTSANMFGEKMHFHAFFRYLVTTCVFTCALTKCIFTAVQACSDETHFSRICRHLITRGMFMRVHIFGDEPHFHAFFRYWVTTYVFTCVQPCCNETHFHVFQSHDNSCIHACCDEVNFQEFAIIRWQHLCSRLVTKRTFTPA